jgi:deoxyribodipyrimidine photolyase-related protein
LAEEARSKRLRELHLRGNVRRLLVLFGDQLDAHQPVLENLDRKRDAVLLMEVADEATHVPSHKQRTILFLSAMRHFALELGNRGFRVHYVRLDQRGNTQLFDGEFRRAVKLLQPQGVDCVHPGEWRVLQMVETWRDALDVPLEIHDDAHFYVTPAEFRAWADGRKELILEYFYRHMRRKLQILMDEGEPDGGKWNYDKENRRPLKTSKKLPEPAMFEPDEVTREVIDLVEQRFADAPGSARPFRWPVSRRQALRALRDFVEQRLAKFGGYQDALVTDEPWVYHARISPLLNCKLLNPREVVDAVLEAYEAGDAPLNSVEGFVRQIIGWREFIRGVYWHEGPDYRERNTFDQNGSLPQLYWTGETDMRCMQQCVGQVLEHGYGHHIQRLMVTGNFALIAGVSPQEISDWYLAMYVDAVDWVTLPNTLGMVMHADGGVVGTKPYAASGQYIKRMSDYCQDCRYKPGERTGDDACPFSTFYWDFLLKHERTLRKNQRMRLILKNLDRIESSEKTAIRKRANRIRQDWGISD